MAEKEEKKKRLFCPYCDSEMTAPDGAYCQVCGVTVFYCPKCRNPVPREKKICPYCGAEIKGEED
jgi:RNA polymerase subunit RPABC4/transcription elongation factor Spt4